MRTLKSAPVLINGLWRGKVLSVTSGSEQTYAIFLVIYRFHIWKRLVRTFSVRMFILLIKRTHIRDIKVKWKWRDIRPSMVTNTRNLCCAINPSKVGTYSSEQTHREHTPGAVGRHLCCGPWGGVGGLVSCSRATQSWYWRWKRALHIDSPHLQFNTSPNL